MKRSIIITAVTAMLISVTSFAQNHGNSNESRPKSPEEKMQMQAVRMADRLLLDQATASKFVELYKEYRLATKQINDKYRRPRPQRGQAVEASPRTDEQVDKQIRDQFAKSQEILDLRVKFYDKFLTVLSPKQIQEMYRLEKETANEAMTRKNGNDRPHGNHPHPQFENED